MMKKQQRKPEGYNEKRINKTAYLSMETSRKINDALIELNQKNVKPKNAQH